MSSGASNRTMVEALRSYILPAVRPESPLPEDPEGTDALAAAIEPGHQLAEVLQGLVDDGAGLVIGVGFLFGDAITAAAEGNPDTSFGGGDGKVPIDASEGGSDIGYSMVVLSQEGFPSSGVRRVRDVMPTAEQWRVGAAPGRRWSASNPVTGPRAPYCGSWSAPGRR